MTTPPKYQCAHKTFDINTCVHNFLDTSKFHTFRQAVIFHGCVKWYNKSDVIPLCHRVTPPGGVGNVGAPAHLNFLKTPPPDSPPAKIWLRKSHQLHRIFLKSHLVFVKSNFQLWQSLVGLLSKSDVNGDLVLILVVWKFKQLKTSIRSQFFIKNRWILHVIPPNRKNTPTQIPPINFQLDFLPSQSVGYFLQNVNPHQSGGILYPTTNPTTPGGVTLSFLPKKITTWSLTKTLKTKWENSYF